MGADIVYGIIALKIAAGRGLTSRAVQVNFFVVNKPTTCAALFLLVTGWFAVCQGQTSKATFQIYAIGGDVKAPRPVSTPMPPPPNSVDKNLNVRRLS